MGKRILIKIMVLLAVINVWLTVSSGKIAYSQVDRSSAEANLHQGIIYLQQGKIDQAIAEFNKAIQKDPDFASPHCELGIIYLQQGKIDQAIAEFNKAIQIDPKYARSHYWLGNIYSQKGEFFDAEKAIYHNQEFLTLNLDTDHPEKPR